MTGKLSDVPWIIGTGTSNHMTGCVENMCEIWDGNGCLVRQRWTTSIINKRRNRDSWCEYETEKCFICAKTHLQFESVLQLIDESNCFVQFTQNLCVVQDRTLRMLIGAGERRDGLYYFRKVPSVKAFKMKGVGSLDLWHKRLGHPSSKIVKLVPNVTIDQNSDLINKACDACQQAK